MKVCVIGLGPAGLFATKTLIDNNIEVIALDKGKKPSERTKKEVLFGVGGAGLFSDGKLNFTPFIGGDLTEFVELSEANRLIDNIEKTFTNYGLTNGYEGATESEIRNIDETATRAGIRFVKAKQKHIGSDYLVKIVQNLFDDLIKRGLDARLETEVTDLIIKDNKIIALETNKGKIEADYFMFCVGRYGSLWLNKITKKYNIDTRALATDIGVRVETNATITKRITDVVYDPKLHIFTETFDDFVRTFCTNPNGFVVSESWDGFINVNGHALRDKKSDNTNFALLVRVGLTDPIEDSTSYAQHIGELANFLGGGKPILQRLGDLVKGRRSTWKRINTNLVEPTFKEVTPGDIALLLPHRIVIDLIEAFKKLDVLMPGIYSDNTLLYAPEIKLAALRIITDKSLRSVNYKNLYFAGDGAGLSRDITNAAATGIIASENIIKEIKK